MTSLPTTPAAFRSLTHVTVRPPIRRILLACGIAAPAWWVAFDVVGSLRYPGYSYADQTISELSAEGTSTRTFMLAMSGVPYAVLMTAFGMGVWLAAGWTRAGRITGALLVGEAVFGFVGGLLFPMATREVIAAGEDTLRNQIHAPYGIGMPVFFMLAIGFGSKLLGKRFQFYSYGTILTTFVFGLLTSLRAGQLNVNRPTPWLGIEERITAYVPMIWLMALAIALLRAQPERLRDGRRQES